MQDCSYLYDVRRTMFEDRIHKNNLFHYTSITGFFKMLENIKDKECYLFPGNLMYQNDSNEFIEGINSIKNLKKDIEDPNVLDAIDKSLNNLNNNIYIACFSSQRDLLDQWKYYGKDCGLSIEFDFSECEGFWQKNAKAGETVCIQSFEIHKNKDIDDNFFTNKKFDSSDHEMFSFSSKNELTRNGITLDPINVIYKDKTDVIKNIINNRKENMDKLQLYRTPINNNGYISHAISSFIPICKNHYFEHERESRLIFHPMKDTEILYREKSNRILPFIKCLVVNKNSEKYPIKSITVGPGANQNLIFNAVINFLEGVDNDMFISEEKCSEVLKKDSNSFTNANDLIKKTEYHDLKYILGENDERTIVYHSIGDILVYKSPIPFRD